MSSQTFAGRRAGRSCPSTWAARTPGPPSWTPRARSSVARSGRPFGELVELVRVGDMRARLVWDDVVAAAGAGVASLAQLFSPELVVVGGGLGLTGDLLYEPIRATLGALDPEICRSRSGSRGRSSPTMPVIGAAGWTRTFDPTPAPEAAPA